jgi:MFS transporter, ACS family, tartrate transporter
VTDPNLESATMRQVSLRLLPFLLLLYIFCWLDRSNVSFAALQMNQELKFSSTAFGFGAGIYFLSYALFEIPSNLILARIGARRWFARIAISWGIIACAMMFVRTPAQFYVLRFLLGLAEAGFFPGVVYYLGLWFPTAYRARAMSIFMLGITLSQSVGALVGSALLGLDGAWSLSGWQWLFVLEGIPSSLLGAGVLICLTDGPAQAGWLSVAQREWLASRLEDEHAPETAHASPLRALANPFAWALIVPYFALCANGYGVTFWGPLLVRESLNTSNAKTGLVIAGMYLLASLAYPLFGMLSDRRGDRCGLAGFGLALYCVGCIVVAMLPPSPLRVAALVVTALGNPMFMSSFWCLPTRFLQGTSAAAGIALISSIGTTGGFFGPAIIGFLKDAAGSDRGAFFGLAGVALLGALILFALRQSAMFRRPAQRMNGATQNSEPLSFP